MADCTVTFRPHNITTTVPQGTSLLEAATAAEISIDNLCGGDGICGRCRMIVKKGEVSGSVSGKLSRDEIKAGYVLACMTHVQSDLEVEIPPETMAKGKAEANKGAERFEDLQPVAEAVKKRAPDPLITKVYLELEKPTLAANDADHQRVCTAIRKKLDIDALQMGLKIIQRLPSELRNNDYKVTATVGLRRDVAEVMYIEGGDTSDRNYIAVFDIGTTTIVAHLVDANSGDTIDAEACYNSQGVYGREVTARIMSAEKRGIEELQEVLVEDINQLIRKMGQENNINLKDITAVVCSGNTAIFHFLLGLPPEHIRRKPYVATTLAPPPLRAAEIGIQINPRGLLYSLPGIGGWAGSDITAGILATGLHETENLTLLVDIGTNGEIVIGNRDWLIGTSASVGPALEVASEECGMRAETGAIDKVYSVNGTIEFNTIDDAVPRGICGSGIIDLISTLLNVGVINRSGIFIEDSTDKIETVEGIKRFVLVDKDKSHTGRQIYITESDIENIITAKAAIFAAITIIMERVDLSYQDIDKLFIAGGFGNYIDIDNAINIGLIPNIDREKVSFVGNTSIKGSKLVALYKEELKTVEHIMEITTYYDLMGANDYVDEFRKAMFLPHTNIELFRSTV
jgi:uncharacterized 2Fe-2S/4Fe-4S cluster protein (DUF4445 family)